MTTLKVWFKTETKAGKIKTHIYQNGQLFHGKGEESEYPWLTDLSLSATSNGELTELLRFASVLSDFKIPYVNMPITINDEMGHGKFVVVLTAHRYCIDGYVIGTCSELADSAILDWKTRVSRGTAPAVCNAFPSTYPWLGEVMAFTGRSIFPGMKPGVMWSTGNMV